MALFNKDDRDSVVVTSSGTTVVDPAKLLESEQAAKDIAAAQELFERLSRSADIAKKPVSVADSTG